MPFGQRIGLDDFGMQGGDTVNGVSGVAGDPGHVNLSVGHRRHVVNATLIQAAMGHIFAEAAIDFFHQLPDAPEQLLEDGHFPALQCLREHGVVGVREGLGDDLPRRIPAQTMVIEQYAQELWDGEHWVSVIELDGVVLRKTGEVLAVLGNVVIHHGLQGCGDKEVLLANAQYLALVGGVVGVEHAADIHDALAIDNGLRKTLGVEGVVIEFIDGLGLPQA